MGCYEAYPWYYRTFSFTLSGLLATVFLFGTSQPTHITQAQHGYSVRFYGSDTNDGDRVKIPLGLIDSNGRMTTSYPINLANAFTIEFWMKATASDNSAHACSNGWYTGNIILDRDVFGAGDYGDYGVAICDQRLVVGVSVGSDDRLLIGSTVVTDGRWRHIAITRAESGQIRLFVDGQLAGEVNGAVGRIDYREHRSTNYPNSDPYLVLGAEKHDYPGSRYYKGLLDDLRFSRVVRYTTSFTRPTTPHPIDADTVALYRFDEGSGVRIDDSVPGGLNTGELKPRAGGTAQHWSTDTPFSSTSPTSTIVPTATSTVASTATSTVAPTATYTIVPTATSTVASTATSTVAPTATHTIVPTATSTVASTATSTVAPTATVTGLPTTTRTTSPTATATIVPTVSQTPSVTPSIGSVPIVPTPHIRVYVPLITYVIGNRSNEI